MTFNIYSGDLVYVGGPVERGEWRSALLYTVRVSNVPMYDDRQDNSVDITIAEFGMLRINVQSSLTKYDTNRSISNFLTQLAGSYISFDPAQTLCGNVYASSENFSPDKYHYLITNMYKSVLHQFKHQVEWDFRDMVRMVRSKWYYFVDERHRLQLEHSSPDPKRWHLYPDT